MIFKVFLFLINFQMNFEIIQVHSMDIASICHEWRHSIQNTEPEVVSKYNKIAIQFPNSERVGVNESHSQLTPIHVFYCLPFNPIWLLDTSGGKGTPLLLLRNRQYSRNFRRQIQTTFGISESIYSNLVTTKPFLPFYY